MHYIEKLKRFGKKTITKRELESIFHVSADMDLFGIIVQLSEENILSPVKNAKTNGNRVYPTFEKYKISIPQDTYATELKEINALHPLILQNGYLQIRPEEYIKYRPLLKKLDRFLFSGLKGCQEVSRKERSFEIFDEEKVLDDKTFCAFLFRLGITQDMLQFYDTPEYCFNDYIPHKKPHMTLLICENKDIWFNIRRMMFESHTRIIFDTPIDGVVYGCGNKISGAGALTSYTEFIGSEAEYLYWGDIDRAGFNIYLSTIRNNPTLNITLFAPAYEAMLRLAQARNIPNSQDERERMDDYSSIYNSICKDLHTALADSIEHNKRIPQEIISYASLQKIMR
jgi:hypothetical protein